MFTAAEKQAIDGSEMGITSIKRSRGLTPSEKKTLVPKRLIPLVVSLLVLGGAVAIHLLIPLPSSRELMGLMEIALTISPRNLRHDKVGNKSDFLLLRKLTLKI